MNIDYKPITDHWSKTIAYGCPKCGAVINDQDIHTDFHINLMNLKDFADQHHVKLG